MSATASSTPVLFSALGREFALALLVGVPALTFVLSTNQTASFTFILWHGLLLFWFVPPCVVLLERLARGPGGSQLGLLRSASLRVTAVALGTAATVSVLALSTRVPWHDLVGFPLLVSLMPLVLAYAMVGLAREGMALREHALRVEASELRARQAALAARIRPHFLFNALNCIEELTVADPEAARLSVGRLARLFHAVLDASHRPMSPFLDELALVDDYLAIEQIRFGTRFRYDLERNGALSSLELPSTVLLTLAENAIKHGVEATPGPVQIQLRAATLPDQRVRITLIGPKGKEPVQRNQQGSGYGLYDVRERLTLSYGERASLTHVEVAGETHVELTIPC